MCKTVSLPKRMEQIISVSYDILCNKIANGSIIVQNEASLQMQFGVILKQVGQLYEFSDQDHFKIELETPREIEASTKSNRGQARCDISLRLFNDSDSIGAEIELKYFKYDKTQEAVTDNRFSVLMDLENLELYKKREPRLMCYEFVYTDNKNYANPSTTSGIKLAPCITQSYTYGGKTINLNACYEAEWTAYGEHYFMKTRI